MTETNAVDELERRFGIPGTVRFEADQNGLIRAIVETPHAEATLYLHGAHVTHYQPRGGRPVLFTSRESRFHQVSRSGAACQSCFPGSACTGSILPPPCTDLPASPSGGWSLPSENLTASCS